MSTVSQQRSITDSFHRGRLSLILLIFVFAYLEEKALGGRPFSRTRSKTHHQTPLSATNPSMNLMTSSIQGSRPSSFRRHSTSSSNLKFTGKSHHRPESSYQNRRLIMDRDSAYKSDHKAQKSIDSRRLQTAVGSQFSSGNTIESNRVISRDIKSSYRHRPLDMFKFKTMIRQAESGIELLKNIQNRLESLKTRPSS